MGPWSKDQIDCVSGSYQVRCRGSSIKKKQGFRQVFQWYFRVSFPIINNIYTRILNREDSSELGMEDIYPFVEVPHTSKVSGDKNTF